MALDIRPFSQIPPSEIQRLSEKMSDYYKGSPTDYYDIADEDVRRYNPQDLPFHWHLVSNIAAGMMVCEVGCGMAHLCPNVLGRGAGYTGLDWGGELLEKNRLRYPEATFLSTALPLDRQFDVVASLYTLEHVPNPPEYLDRLWKLCKPGGRVAIICPEFVNGSLPPSCFYGLTPRRLREKVASGSLLDSILHFWELKVTAPRWKKRAQSLGGGQFWINLRPRILEDARFSRDTDAVHLPRFEDLEWWFAQRQGIVEATSKSLSGIPAEILAYNQYFLVRKPA